MSNPPDDSRASELHRASMELADTFRDGILSELDDRFGPKAPGSFQEAWDKEDKEFRVTMLRALIMDLAGVELSPDATAADRNEGVVKGLRGILSHEDLFRLVTHVPHSDELTNSLMPPKLFGDQAQEIREARELKARVAKGRFLERSMVPVDRMVRLEYLSEPVRRKIRQQPPPQTLTLDLLAVSGRGWDVNVFKAKKDGRYRDPLGRTRRVPLNDVFSVVSVSGTATRGIPKYLVNERVQVGQLGVGKRFTMRYGFSRQTEEVHGYGNDSYSSQTAELPYTLSQAYYGTSQDFPLF